MSNWIMVGNLEIVKESIVRFKKSSVNKWNNKLGKHIDKPSLSLTLDGGYKGGDEYIWSYDTEAERNEAYQKVWDFVNERKVVNMGCIKEYFDRHQDQLITLGIVILLDHILFGGMLKDKIKGTLEKLLGATEKKLTGGD